MTASGRSFGPPDALPLRSVLGGRAESAAASGPIISAFGVTSVAPLAGQLHATAPGRCFELGGKARPAIMSGALDTGLPGPRCRALERLEQV